MSFKNIWPDLSNFRLGFCSQSEHDLKWSMGVSFQPANGGNRGISACCLTRRAEGLVLNG